MGSSFGTETPQSSTTSQRQPESSLTEKLKTIADDHDSEFKFFIRSLAQPHAQQVHRDWEAFRHNTGILA